MLNTGQQLIIAVGLVAMLWRATAGRGGRPHDAGRPGDGQRLHDPAVHPAQLPGRAVPRDQAEPDRPGQDVRADGKGARGRGQARRAAAAAGCSDADGALRERELRLRAGAADPAPRELRDPGRQDGGGGRAFGLGQVDAGAAAVPLLRRAAGPHHHRRPGHPRSDAGQRAPGHRHRAAGHGAVQRHGGIQHRLRPPGREPRRGGRGGARRAHPRLHRVHAQGLRRPWWASAA